MNNKKIGNLILKLRKEHNLTQEELASKIYIGREAISKWEHGKTIPDITSLMKLSEIFNITINELIYGEQITPENEPQIKTFPATLYKKLMKNKKFYLITVITIITIIILFLGYYFLNNYRKTFIYELHGGNNDAIIKTGIIFKNAEKIYLNISDIETTKESTFKKLYYVDKNNKEHHLITVNNSYVTIKELHGYNEYFDFKNFDYIIENLFLEISFADYTNTILKIEPIKIYSNTNLFPEKVNSI